MRKALLWCATLLLAAGPAFAQEADSDQTLAAGRAVASEAEAEAEDQRTPAARAAVAGRAESEQRSGLGMSILGNQEAPTSLVIVPWKSSELGAGIGVARALDTTIRPVDKDVFMRELRYYQIRANETQ